MKKVIMVFLFTIGISALVFPLHETWFSVGYEYGFSMDTYKYQGREIDTKTNSAGVNLSTYSFFTNNVGIFVHASFLFPKHSWVWNDGGISKVDFNNYAGNINIGFIIGLAYKIDFTDDFKSYFGIGFNYLVSSSTYAGRGITSYDRSAQSFGIAGDMGLKFDITDRCFLKLGSIFAFDFLRHTSIDTYTGASHTRSSSDWDKGYFMLSARPYIAAGINLYRGTGNNRFKLTTGKPNKEN